MAQLTQAMVLTAGMSTRMRPLTLNTPKILLPVIGKNLFERTLQFLSAQHIDSVSMNLFHGKDLLKKQIQQNHSSTRVQGFDENPIRGTGGGILGMKSFIHSDHFAVLNCDFLTETILQKMLEFHLQKKALATLLMIPVPMGGKYSTVELSADQKIMSFAPSVRQKYFFGGIHILSKEIFNQFPSGYAFCIIRNVYEQLIAQKASIYGFCQDVPWYDLGEVKLYYDSLFGLLNKPLSWMSDFHNKESMIDVSVTVPAEVKCQNVIVEEKVTFQSPCQLKHTVVFPYTNVKSGNYQNMILTPEYQLQI